MAKLTLNLPAGVRATPNKPRMSIQTTDGKWKYNVRMAPLEANYEGFGSSWSEVAVPGAMPFLVKEAFNLKKFSFTIIVADPDNPDADMTEDLRILKAFSDTTRPIKISYDGYPTQWTWRCTSFKYTSQRRHPATSKITKASVDMEFTFKNDVVDFTGPITGGAKSSTKKSSTGGATSGKSTGGTKKKTTKKTSNPTKKTTTKVYVVKKGDTLSGIAYKLYGDTSKWRQLADRNGVKNPRLLQIGKRLKY